jgi:hypothetical protein
VWLTTLSAHTACLSPPSPSARSNTGTASAIRPFSISWSSSAQPLFAAAAIRRVNEATDSFSGRCVGSAGKPS